MGKGERKEKKAHSEWISKSQQSTAWGTVTVLGHVTTIYVDYIAHLTGKNLLSAQS